MLCFLLRKKSFNKTNPFSSSKSLLSIIYLSITSIVLNKKSNQFNLTIKTKHLRINFVKLLWGKKLFIQLLYLGL